MNSFVPPALFSSLGYSGEGVPQSSAPGSGSVDRLQLVPPHCPGLLRRRGLNSRAPSHVPTFPALWTHLGLAGLMEGVRGRGQRTLQMALRLREAKDFHSWRELPAPRLFPVSSFSRAYFTCGFLSQTPLTASLSAGNPVIAL